MLHLEETMTATGTRPAAPPAVGAIARITEAWARNDAAAFAAVFTEDATMVLPGQYAKGREEIEAFMTAGYSGPYRGSRVTGAPVDARVLGDDLAIIVTEGGVLMDGDTEVHPSRKIKATWVVVRDTDGEWRLSAYHNAPVAR